MIVSHVRSSCGCAVFCGIVRPRGCIRCAFQIFEAQRADADLRKSTDDLAMIALLYSKDLHVCHTCAGVLCSPTSLATATSTATIDSVLDRAILARPNYLHLAEGSHLGSLFWNATEVLLCGDLCVLLIRLGDIGGWAGR